MKQMAQVPSTLFLSKQQELSKIWRVENKRARKLTVSDPWKRIICLEILTILSGDFFFFNQKKDTLKKLIFLFWKDSLKSAFEWVLSDYQNKMFWFIWNNSIPFCKIISYDFVVFFSPWMENPFAGRIYKLVTKQHFLFSVKQILVFWTRI